MPRAIIRHVTRHPVTFRAEFTSLSLRARPKSPRIFRVYELVSTTRASLGGEFLSSSTRPRRVYKIMSETKRKVAAGRSHGSCGSAPRNYGSCHGCSFVDGVFAPRGGCPNHEPRKLHPLPIPYPYYFASTHPLSRSPENHPFLLFVFHPLPSPPTHPLSLSHPIPSPTPYTLDIVADLLTPRAVVSR